MSYNAPLSDLRFAIQHLAGYDHWAQKTGSAFDQDMVAAVLEEAARFANEQLAPIYRLGDTKGAHLDATTGVTVPDEFVEAYRQFVEAGWNGISAEETFGGQNAPQTIAMAVQECWHGSNMAFALCPMLTQAAVEAITAHGSEAQKQTFLPKLISGEWTGTMVLTEPQAGSDLAALQCKAVPDGEHFRLHGQKIYITWGEHNMAANTIHLVLARTPNAPQGIKGISLFIVPKVLVNDDGSLGEKNQLKCLSLEHKLGIHASPTCVMEYGDGPTGALGYLVGEEGRGLHVMFTMMNLARLAVGVEGVAIADRAYQQAARYAKDRVQGTLPGEQESVTIIHHPNVRRMLLTMKSQTEAMRALYVTTAMTIDQAASEADVDMQRRLQRRVDLLVPVVKGWCTELAQTITSLAVQVHGGMGYIEETGVAQTMRDARITTIYEGTTGIQAKDLLGRKILRDRGAAMFELIAELREELAALPSENDGHAKLLGAIDALEASVQWVLAQADPLDAVSAAYNLLMATGTVLGGYWLTRSAAVTDAGSYGLAFLQAKRHTAEFYLAHCLPQAHAYTAAAQAGKNVLLDLDEAAF